MKFVLGRTSNRDEAPHPKAQVLEIAISDWWHTRFTQPGHFAHNRRTAQEDGYIKVWAIEVATLDDLLAMLPEQTNAWNELIVGRTVISGEAYHYIEIYDTHRE